MTALLLQRLLGSIFLLLGAWALFFPLMVESIVVKPEHQLGTISLAIFVGCFGAQALLCSTLIFFTQFTARTFLIFGLVGSLPFFVFNYYFVFVQPVFTSWMLLDFLGNTGILACGIGGWYLKRRELPGV